MIKRQKTYQKTIDVNGHKIKVFIKTRTSLGNFCGYSARITDNKGNDIKIPMINVLMPDDAMDKAYVKFIKTIIN